ncbi:FAD-binding oxidoreductase [Actinophytocola sp.]|uniref:FAD-binding oxidoreductase n=1 Tax=Actinophytocola sp. TaxID=1872138 RepID=UPI002ED4700D
MIVAATTPADVRKAVLTARERSLRFAVYATGHGGPPPEDDDVVVLETTGMGGVLVDPDRRVARVGPGAVWGDVVAAAAPFGLAPLSGTSPEVGVVGYTLGGGMAWLSRRYGFAADSVVRADIVTADGDPRTVSADHDPDLFWAIRGGGANFGAVTGLEFRLYPVTTVHAGAAWFPIERAADVLAYYRDHLADLPDELAANIVITKEALGIRGMYAGPAEDARRALAPLWRVAGTPTEDGWRTMPYTESGTIGTTTPSQYNLLRDLPDPMIEAAVDAVHGDAAAVEVRPWGGAIARPNGDAGPISHRDVPFTVAVDGPPESAAGIAAHATGFSFLNALADPSRVHTAFTAADHARLRELKRTYDPENMFGLAKNIPPAPPATARLRA